MAIIYNNLPSLLKNGMTFYKSPQYNLIYVELPHRNNQTSEKTVVLKSYDTEKCCCGDCVPCGPNPRLMDIGLNEKFKNIEGKPSDLEEITKIEFERLWNVCKFPLSFDDANEGLDDLEAITIEEFEQQ